MSPRSIPNAAIACGSVSPPGRNRIGGSTSESKQDCLGDADGVGGYVTTIVSTLIAECRGDVIEVIAAVAQLAQRRRRDRLGRARTGNAGGMGPTDVDTAVEPYRSRSSRLARTSRRATRELSRRARR
jgi:hypothetical protein